MARYIDVNKFKEWIRIDHDCCKRIDCKSVHYDCTDCYYNHGGAEDVAPVVHARWSDEREYCHNFICSNCGKLNNNNFDEYCKHCGAKMDKE